MPRFFRFHVRLRGVEPAPWRRFLLSEDATFTDLHDAIQDACRWQDCHLHAFLEGRRGGEQIASSLTVTAMPSAATCP